VDRIEALADGRAVAQAITATGLSHDAPLPDDALVLSRPALQALLDEELRGLVLDQPIRTRSKVAKQAVCRALGYPVPDSFRKVQPRFSGQDVDVYVQKANNLQIWNEEVAPDRRYVLIRVDDADRVTKVRVLTGQELALLDTTGTLTSKFQARRRPGSTGSRLVTAADTDQFVRALDPRDDLPHVGQQSADEIPEPANVFTIQAVYASLLALVGRTLPDPGAVQDRLRGVELQKAACDALGIGSYADSGQFPDLMVQALEVKLQTSPTIDLGLVLPTSEDHAEGLGYGLRHADVRYAVVFGSVSKGGVEIESVVVTTGERFFEEFVQFGGQVSNSKIQIPLPESIFD
jgi:hypothetical protein